MLCNNNIALCCLRLKNFAEAVQFGKNALMLVETLESRIPQALVWQCLVVTSGMTLDKFRKDWKKKSLFLVGKAELGLCNFQSALDALKAALALIADDESLAKNSEELRALIATASSRRAAEKKKERATWSKAFEKGKRGDSSLYSDPDPVSPAASPLKPAAAAAAEEDDGFHMDLSRFGLKDIGTKKTAAAAKPAAAPAAKKEKVAAASSTEVWKPSTSSGPLTIFMGVLATILGLSGLWWKFGSRRY